MLHYDPVFYDLLHTGNLGDLDFYLNSCKGIERVLELGCGSGRITTELLKKNIKVTALDNNPLMLEALKKRAKELTVYNPDNLLIIEASMDAPPKTDIIYDRVIIPYNALLCLTDGDAVKNCFKSAASLLKKKGQLIFDIYNFPTTDDEYDVCDYNKENFDDIEDCYFLCSSRYKNRVVDIYEKELVTHQWNRFDATYIYKYTGENNKQIIREYTIPQRWYSIAELKNMLRESGFKDIKVLGDFSDLPISGNTNQIAFIAG